MSLKKEDLIELSLEATGMTRARWDELAEILKDDAAMNAIMRGEWWAAPRDSEDSIREYYRKSDIWFANTFNHGYNALLSMAAGDSRGLDGWRGEFAELLGGSGGEILDYGGGIFKDSWPLVMAGYRVDVAEVAGPVTEFLKKYIALSGVRDRLGVVEVGSATPLTKTYRGIICFETLEHVLCPVELTKHLHEHLIKGGPFAVSASFGDTPHAPYHVAKNTYLGDETTWRRTLSGIGFTPHGRDVENMNRYIWRKT